MLYSQGCPGGVPTADILRGILLADGALEKAPNRRLDLSVEEFGHAEFLALGTPGSPTVLLDGQDLFPPRNQPLGVLPAASCCRLYATPEGLGSHPTRRMVLDALNEAATGGGA